jgi:DNA-binding PadR family transcriptional regulator
MTQHEKNAVWQGTLSLMVLRTLLTMGEQHGYGIARRIEQTSEGQLVSDNNRKAKYYRLTKAGRRQIERDTRQWEAMAAIMTRFLAPGEER